MNNYKHHILIIIISLFALVSCQQEKIALTPLAADATLLAFGDSLTYGTGAKRGQSYPATLSKMLNRNVINTGIPGEVSADGLKRLPALLDRHQPDLLLLCHGANDILRRKDLSVTANNLKQMIELAHSRQIDVILIGVPEFSLFLNTADFYQEIAEQYQLLFIEDALGKILSDPSLKADPIHPNGAGYQIMAEAIYKQMQEAGTL